MFGQKNLRAVVVNFAGVRVKDDREQDQTHLVDFSFETPLTPDLAEDINPRYRSDFFDEQKKGPERWTPKGEMNEVKLSIKPGPQFMEIRPHPEVDAFARLEGVLIRHPKIKKATKSDVWFLSWVVTFALHEETVMGLLRNIKNAVFITFEAQERELPLESDTDLEQGGADESGAGRVVRRRRRRNAAQPPEQQALGPAGEETPPASPPPVDQFADVPAYDPDAVPGDDPE